MTHWRKSRQSDAQGDACVELAALPDGVGVRDSKDPAGGPLMLTPAAFRRLVEQWK
ncbi:DUF397 domain-containing protein [Actinomadura sp. WMMB 499]|uniref:DUF397 domain-containing protein n=1 Tax=Actinomadura sp. WMMB 499 TaxID=1219491 RepID=UPI001246197C|nr:DUF397 domain-containing protein [Actinomadura sp. WMMB 499]QFG24284.1 DUF397 domain-containing protein [Actinomadura sp. WMMB 499]